MYLSYRYLNNKTVYHYKNLVLNLSMHITKTKCISIMLMLCIDQL